ncbi:MAG: enoyl-CoA hydratase/isomerase family protein [Acidimicrobiaceae bacterium]|nr:enoyl-CoA hydratase/isomerase family protein [Acidimicrobiaceae bacterium]MYB85667.1 enoyl-CoA hydratase/isomerase family protein [Acidimicrobiaceae bacterium]MYH92603.1 enoyl-CoA hydratase/isomerase family protein [Acidimicrobiaceae bacterium]
MSDVIGSVDGSIWQIRMDRPERANALRRETIRQIGAVLNRAEGSISDAARDADAGAAGLLLTGSPRAFSAGADLSELTGTTDDLGFDDELERLCRRLTLSPLPVVAAVEAPATAPLSTWPGPVTSWWSPTRRASPCPRPDWESCTTRHRLLVCTPASARPQCAASWCSSKSCRAGNFRPAQQ